MPFTATVLTMFPDAFPGPLGVSLIGTAWREHDRWRLETVDIRAFSNDKRGFLDDTPAGGGPGQVMRADVIASALDSVEGRGRPLLYMSARGRPLTQARAKAWAATPGLVVLCGRFEGVDQRLLDARGFEEVSIGDAVLAGGEAAALVLIDRGRSRGGISPRCCCQATMARWPNGDRPRGKRQRGSGARTCGRRISPINRQRALKPGNMKD
jgi:tRNA (guanine37-N1)-methyltransferase